MQSANKLDESALQTNATNSDYIRMLTAALGVFMFMLAGFIITSFPIEADLPEGFRTPMIAFEFATNVNDLVYLEGTSKTARANRENMRSFLLWDMSFLGAYTGFLLLMFCELLKSQRPLALAGVVATLIIVPLDISENLTLLDIVSTMTSNGDVLGLLADLHLQTWLKWGAFCAVFSILSTCFARNHERWSAILAVFPAIGIGICFLTNSDPIWAERMGTLILVFFLAFTLKEVFFVLRTCNHHN